MSLQHILTRFDLISRLYSRYLYFDSELEDKVKRYGNKDVFSKIKKIVPEAYIPRLNSLEKTILEMSEENYDKIIPKRVDLKHVGKTTFGEIYKEYAKRLNKRSFQIKSTKLNFKGLKEVKRNDLLLDLTYFSVSALSIEANIADDIRHQFRSEIEEATFDESTLRDRVGSSTMPHKINPKEFEQIKSLWKAFGVPYVASAVMYQITENQGDSTNQELPHNTYNLIVAICYTTKRLEDSLRTLKLKSNKEYVKNLNSIP